MTPAKASKTAAQMALSRAIESRMPTVDRVCFDPFAERFLGAAYRMLLVARPLRASIVRIIELLFAGHHHYVLVRTRYIDDFLDQHLTPDVRQLVILGAGYDSRAYRFGDRLRDVAVFEVDHPATSRRKLEAVEKILGSVPPHVTYVAVDFDRDALGERLEDAGFRSELRTIFLWEGTTPYLSAEAVDEMLRFVRSGSASGSVILFDYVLRSVLDGTCGARGAQNERNRMTTTSEPFVFGIEDDEVQEFLAARGFCDVHDVGGDALRTRYLRGDRDEYVKPWWHIVHASVP